MSTTTEIGHRPSIKRTVVKKMALEIAHAMGRRKFQRVSGEFLADVEWYVDSRVVTLFVGDKRMLDLADQGTCLVDKSVVVPKLLDRLNREVILYMSNKIHSLPSVGITL